MGKNARHVGKKCIFMKICYRDFEESLVPDTSAIFGRCDAQLASKMTVEAADDMKTAFSRNIQYGHLSILQEVAGFADPILIDIFAVGVVCFKRLIHHDMSKSLKTYKATKQKGDSHEQTENNRTI